MAGTRWANQEHRALEAGVSRALAHPEITGRVRTKVTGYGSKSAPDMADEIRYKVYDDQGNIIVDHRISGHRESLPKGQATLLGAAVEHSMYGHFGVEPIKRSKAPPKSPRASRNA